jgi:hypothetical protein
MSSAAAVLACALALLGKSERTMPRIVLVETPPIGVSAGAEAYVLRADPTIYLLTSSYVFREAQRTKDSCGDLNALKKLASILAHEAWHVENGPDESGAYHEQLTTLIFLGVSPGSSLYGSVVRSMQAVLKQRRHERPDLVLAGKQLSAP